MQTFTKKISVRLRGLAAGRTLHIRDLLITYFLLGKKSVGVIEAKREEEGATLTGFYKTAEKNLWDRMLGSR